MLEPKLRFKEFKDNYIKYKLNEVVNFYRGNILSKSDIIESGKTPCILYGELYTKYSEIAYRIFSFTNNSNTNLFYSKENDVLIPCSGETALDISTSTCVLFDNIAIGGDLNVLRPKDQSGKYLSYLLSHKKRLEIAKYAQGDSIVHLYADKIRNINVYLPSYMEQEKIANLLSLLDKKIELQKLKIETLKIYKKGLIMQILKVDNTNSKNYHISECINIFDKRTTINNQYPILSSTHNGLQMQNDYFNRQTASENNIGYKIIPRNYITYRSMSDTGDFYFNLQNIVDFGIVSPAYPVFRTSNFVDIYYFLYYLNYSSNMKRQILLNKEGGTRFALSINKLSDIHISLPSYETQINHSYIFRTLDKKINLEEQKLHKLNLLKTSLLQQMFI